MPGRKITDPQMSLPVLGPYALLSRIGQVVTKKTTTVAAKKELLRSFISSMHRGGIPTAWQDFFSALDQASNVGHELIDAICRLPVSQLKRVDEIKIDTSDVEVYVPPFPKEKKPELKAIPFDSIATKGQVENPPVIDIPSLCSIQTLEDGGSKTLSIPARVKRIRPNTPDEAGYSVEARENLWVTKTKENPVYNFTSLAGTARDELVGRGQIARNYGIDWERTKTFRDIQQNFYDGHCGTLEGVDYKVTKNGDDYTLRIAGLGEYDLEKVLTLGAGAKQADGAGIDSVQGKHGEGLKVTALLLLRDLRADRVTYSSRNWLVNYLLPDGAFTLRPEIEQVTDQPGNYMEISTKDPQLVQEILESVNLVYHPYNPDFHNPSLEVPGVGGFKLLGFKDGDSGDQVFNRGNLYLQGQRYQTKIGSADPQWGSGVPGLSLWTYAESFQDEKFNRERPAIDLTDRDGPFTRAVSAILEKSSTDDLLRVFKELEPVWSNWNKLSLNYTQTQRAGIYRLSSFIAYELSQRLKADEARIDFGARKFAAADSNNADQADYALVAKEYGCKIGMPELSYLDVPRIPYFLGDWASFQYDVPADEREKQKLKILKLIIPLLYEEFGINTSTKLSQPYSIDQFCFYAGVGFEFAWEDDYKLEASACPKDLFHLHRKQLNGDLNNDLASVLSRSLGRVTTRDFLLDAVFNNTWTDSKNREKFEDFALLWDKISSEQRVERGETL